MIVAAAAVVTAPELSDAIRLNGDRRFELLFKTVSKEHQRDLEHLREQAIASAKTITEAAQDMQYWSQLTCNYLRALHTKMELLERVQAFGIPDSEALLAFCRTKQHEECVRSLLQNEPPEFVKVLESFCMSFQDPMSAVDAIISYIVPYPKEARCDLIRAFNSLFGKKIRVRAADISLIIPHVYMLLESQDRLKQIAEQCETFEEIQSMLTK